MAERTGQRPEAGGRRDTEINRREFLKASAVASAGTATGLPASLGAAQAAPRTFRLADAPHFGMFRQRALEDNGLKAREGNRAVIDACVAADSW